MTCENSVGFGTYWDENMKTLGLPVPTDVYGAAVTMTGLISVIAGAVEENAMVSLSEAFFKADIKTATKNLGLLYASYWVGAAIGSYAVAAGRVASCGGSIGEALWAAREMGIYGTWLEAEYARNPRIAGKAY